MSRRRNLRAAVLQLEEVQARPRTDPNGAMEKAFLVHVDGENVAIWLQTRSGKFALHDGAARALVGPPQTGGYRFEQAAPGCRMIVEVEEANLVKFTMNMIAQKVI